MIGKYFLLGLWKGGMLGIGVLSARRRLSEQQIIIRMSDMRAALEDTADISPMFCSPLFLTDMGKSKKDTTLYPWYIIE